VHYFSTFFRSTYYDPYSSWKFILVYLYQILFVAYVVRHIIMKHLHVYVKLKVMFKEDTILVALQYIIMTSPTPSPLNPTATSLFVRKVSKGSDLLPSKFTLNTSMNGWGLPVTVHTTLIIFLSNSEQKVKYVLWSPKSTSLTLESSSNIGSKVEELSKVGTTACNKSM